MINLSDLWNTWSGPAGAIVGGALTWAGTLIKAHLQEQRNTLDAGQQALQLVGACQAQQAYLTAAHERAVANELASRAREVATADVVQDLHIDLITARLRCHDVEMRFGLEPTEFPLIPAFPWRVVTENPHSVATDMTGVEAVTAAQPGASTPTAKTAPPTAAAAGS
ncbi:hypothetical protein [Asaia lannensis]|uniref:hypothetical protein n=1 Tax=Asaia lannensis TaxID=415421 RepID=UPI0038739895